MHQNLYALNESDKYHVLEPNKNNKHERKQNILQLRRTKISKPLIHNPNRLQKEMIERSQTRSLYRSQQS